MVATATPPTTIAVAETNPEPISVDGENKSWAAFFKMVGIEAITASEAQKRENTKTRTEQIEKGIKAAMDKGLGTWNVKVAGRSFVRVAVAEVAKD